MFGGLLFVKTEVLPSGDSHFYGIRVTRFDEILPLGNPLGAHLAIWVRTLTEQFDL